MMEIISDRNRSIWKKGTMNRCNSLVKGVDRSYPHPLLIMCINIGNTLHDKAVDPGMIMDIFLRYCL